MKKLQAEPDEVAHAAAGSGEGEVSAAEPRAISSQLSAFSSSGYAADASADDGMNRVALEVFRGRVVSRWRGS